MAEDWVTLPLGPEEHKKSSIGISLFSTAQYIQKREQFCNCSSAICRRDPRSVPRNEAQHAAAHTMEIPAHLSITPGQLVSTLFYTDTASSSTLAKHFTFSITDLKPGVEMRRKRSWEQKERIEKKILQSIKKLLFHEQSVLYSNSKEAMENCFNLTWNKELH